MAESCTCTADLPAPPTRRFASSLRQLGGFWRPGGRLKDSSTLSSSTVIDLADIVLFSWRGGCCGGVLYWYSPASCVSTMSAVCVDCAEVARLAAAGRSAGGCSDAVRVGYCRLGGGRFSAHIAFRSQVVRGASVSVQPKTDLASRGGLYRHRPGPSSGDREDKSICKPKAGPLCIRTPEPSQCNWEKCRAWLSNSIARILTRLRIGTQFSIFIYALDVCFVLVCS